MPFDQSPEIDLRPYVRNETARENLLKLADIVLANEQFSMEMYAHDCETPACILGTAVAAGIVCSRNKTPLDVRASCIHWGVVHNGWCVTELGLTARQAERLFDQYAPWQTAPAAAAELRRLANERVEP